MPARTSVFLARLWVLFAALLDAGAALAEMRVQALELPGRAQPAVTATAEGFLLSWIDREADGASVLRFAELDRDGRPARLGEVARGRDWFVNWADFPSLTVADNGDWVGFILVRSDPARPYAYDILATRSRDRGRSWSVPERLHDDGTPTEHGFVSLLADGDDRVLAVWLDGRRSMQTDGAGHDHDDGHSAAHTSLHTAVLTRTGIVERQELDELTCDCCRTALARDQQGPVALYRDRTREEIRDVFEVARLGTGWSAPRPLPPDRWNMPGCPVNGPAVAALKPGLLAAWPTQDAGTPVLRLALRAAGSWRPLPPLDRGPALQGRVDLAAWTEDSVLAVWLGGEDDRPALRLAEVDHLGKVRTARTLATLPAGRATGMPRIAARDGRAVVVWTQPDGQGPHLAGALIRR